MTRNFSEVGSVNLSLHSMFRFVEKLVLATRIVLKNVSFKIKLTHFFYLCGKNSKQTQKKTSYGMDLLYFTGRLTKKTLFSQDFVSVTNKGDAFSGNHVGFVITLAPFHKNYYIFSEQLLKQAFNSRLN